MGRGSKVDLFLLEADQVFGEMTDLERALEWLRPLILGSNSWDYCVLWKFGDDPSRFIEWVGCCCNGGNGGIKKLKREQNVSIPLCRDDFCEHPANTKACEALATLPSSMPLYSGIHGEVVISNQARWLNIAKTLDSNTLNEEEPFETQVLIPVTGGLIELFAAKLIPENQRIIEFLKAQFNICSEIETMLASTMSFDGHFVDPFLGKSTYSCLSSLNQSDVLAWPKQLIPIAHNFNQPSFDGCSTGSFPSDEHSSPCSLSQSIPVKSCNSHNEDHVVPKARLDARERPEKERCKSKNLFSERNRRNRIKDGLFALRALVPKITKMNRTAILGDAIDYIEELRDQIKELHDEYNSMANEDCNRNISKLKLSRLDGNVGELRDSASFNNKEVSACLTNRPKLEVQVKVNQLGSRDFLLRIVCQHMTGAFTKLLEALGSLGLCVCDVNVTTCNGTISSTLTVQTERKEIREEELRDSLIRIVA